MILRQVDGTTNKLAQISRDDPQGEVFSTGTRRGERQNGTRLCDIPAACADAREEGAKDKVPLVAEFGVTVIRRSADREGHGTNDESPFCPKFVDNRTTEQTDDG